MPANLPPQYFDAEKEYREAKSAEEKIAALEEMLAIMPKHKGTDHLRAELRTRIAKLTQSMGKKATLHHVTTIIPREGAGQVAVIGLPNAGKSQLVASTTNASPEVADYPFTTKAATPGMMQFENVRIQLIDTPPLAPQAIEFWFPNLLKRADALLILIDLGYNPVSQVESIIEQLAKMRIGITGLTPPEGALILSWKKAVIAGNKIDLPGANENFNQLKSKYGEHLPVVAISAKEKMGLEDFKRAVFQVLDLIRVYTKAPGQKPDLNDPIALPRGSTVADAAMSLHRDFAARMKYARVWGSGKHDGVMVSRDHVLQEGDIIELHLPK